MWATSIGSTFSQIPFPGVRKSGIPEGTEIPAPVSATVHSLSRISSASCAAGAEVNGDGVMRGRLPKMALPSEARRLPSRLRRGPPLLPAPLRGTLLKEGGDSLLAVLRQECRCEPLLLGLDPLVQVALVGDRLDLLDSERRLPGELAGPGEGGVEELLVGDQVVGEAVEAG